jgi:ERCC4-type nuclease
VIYEDTRQQKGRHKNIDAYCRQQGIEVIRQALNVGDYQIAGKGEISVDTKQGIPELANNCFQSHERFRDECERAQRCGIRLIILVEEVPPDGDVSRWRSPLDRNGGAKYQFNPATLKKVMETMTERYGVQFRFCDGRSTGKLLIEYLKGERT